jgi:predicted choloylglycine hydrolase
MSFRSRVISFSAALVLSVCAAGPLHAGSDPAIVKNEVLVKHDDQQYMEVRHIVLKGTNEQIGKALADIARESYQTKLTRYADPLYGRARLAYMETNYPILRERMKGVARSFGLPPDDVVYDTSFLNFGTGGPECSAVFIPAAFSATGTNFYAANRDYYLASRSEVMGGKRQPGERDVTSQIFVIELYPDKGYPSIAVGSMELLNGPVDLVNSKGLAVAALEDDTFGMGRVFGDPSRMSGLSLYQACRLIIDTCATVDEAKQAILDNKIVMAILPVHMIVMDSSGKSFIYEKSSADFSDRFIDNDGKPQVITNHSVADYPTLDKFPAPANDSYDTFNRYRSLDGYVKAHTGPFSYDDGRDAMSLAYGRVNEASEGGYHKLPLRTLYTALVDIEKRSVWLKVYSRDGKIDPKDGLPELAFSRPLEFQLRKE